MFVRKAMTLAGLALALAILSPASALAEAGGSERASEGDRLGDGQSDLCDGRLH
jgi:hypothetical protein